MRKYRSEHGVPLGSMYHAQRYPQDEEFSTKTKQQSNDTKMIPAMTTIAHNKCANLQQKRPVKWFDSTK